MSAPNQVQKLRGDGQPNRVQDNVAAVLNPLAKAVGATPIMGAPPPPWVKPSLLNGFENLGAPFADTTYHRDALGYVHARLSLQHAAGTATVSIFEFPLGYRPDSSMLFLGSDGGGNVFEFQLGVDGLLQNATAFAAGDAVYAALPPFLAVQ